MWITFAILSAVFAGLTSILAKCGIAKTDSDIATALRTIVVLIFTCLMVFISKTFYTITEISYKSLLFLILSGIATGASWLCYFKALSIGDVNKVVVIDKLSIILTVLLAIVFFNETNNLIFKIISITFISIGIFIMIEKKKTNNHIEKSWFFYAILSAVFASLTSILAKIGIASVDSNVGTAIRTFVVLIMAWFIVLIKGKISHLKHIDKKELLFICMSGIATGISWLCYYYAIQNGIVSVVVSIDKMSLAITIIFSYFVFKEKINKKNFIGLVLIMSGIILMSIFK